MIELDIPGRSRLNLHHLVFDVNGTLAVDGILLDGIELPADLVVPDISSALDLFEKPLRLVASLRK